jgi:hypothetical protein
MAELTSILIAKREKDYEDKKFMAALKGVNLDEQSGENRGQQEWENMKARVFSGGSAKDANDIVSLQGINAEKAGFGINNGLEYAVVKDSNKLKNPLA